MANTLVTTTFGTNTGPTPHAGEARALAGSLRGQSASLGLAEEYEPFAASGEINLEVSDQTAARAAAEPAFSDARRNQIDGLTVEWHDRWFNLRPSNTEPVLRLNVEAADPTGVNEPTGRVRRVVDGR